MARSFTVGATVAAAALLAPPAAGAAEDKLRTHYLSAYERAERKGAEPGRNIVRDGVLVRGRRDRTRPAREAEIRRSLGVLIRMGGGTPAERRAAGLAPVANRVATPTAARSGATTATAGGGDLPACTWVPESGGDYAARGPGGAGGKYQIIPSTWKAYGGSTANAADASPAEQEAVAARVYAASGGSAWVNC